MAHEIPLSILTFERKDGTTGQLDLHDTESLHDVEGSVKETNIAANAVNTAKIADQAVTTAKLANKAVTTATIADGAVGKEQLSPEVNEAWDSICQGADVSFDVQPNDLTRIIAQRLGATAIIGLITAGPQAGRIYTSYKNNPDDQWHERYI